jgi:hypothetical protein
MAVERASSRVSIVDVVEAGKSEQRARRNFGTTLESHRKNMNLDNRGAVTHTYAVQPRRSHEVHLYAQQLRRDEARVQCLARALVSRNNPMVATWFGGGKRNLEYFYEFRSFWQPGEADPKEPHLLKPDLDKEEWHFSLTELSLPHFEIIERLDGEIIAHLGGAALRQVAETLADR